MRGDHHTRTGGDDQQRAGGGGVPAAIRPQLMRDDGHAIARERLRLTGAIIRQHPPDDMQRLIPVPTTHLTTPHLEAISY